MIFKFKTNLKSLEQMLFFLVVNLIFESFVLFKPFLTVCVNEKFQTNPLIFKTKVPFLN